VNEAAGLFLATPYLRKNGAKSEKIIKYPC
jgi:hypothetical protein